MASSSSNDSTMPQMETSLMRFQPRKTLDDLPEEILKNVYEQYFSDIDICLQSSGYAGPLGEVPSLLTNKKQSRCAREAMLSCATIQIYSDQCAAFILCHCKDAAKIRFLKVWVFHSDNAQYCFPLMDDFFRTLSGLAELRINLFRVYPPYFLNCHEIKLLKDDPGTFFTKEVDRNARWTRSVVADALDRPRWSWWHKEHTWIEDIIEHSAFSGRSKAPEVLINIQMEIECESEHYELLRLSYCLDTRSCFAKIGDKTVVSPQDIVADYRSVGRGGRERLCSGAKANNNLRRALEEAIRRPLRRDERLDLAKYEARRDFERDALDLYADVYYAFNSCVQDDSADAYLAALDFLESQQQPKLRFDSLEQTHDILKDMVGHLVDSLDVHEIKCAWETKEWSTSPRNVTELESFVKTAVPSIDHHWNLWHICYEELYQVRSTHVHR